MQEKERNHFRRVGNPIGELLKASSGFAGPLSKGGLIDSRLKELVGGTSLSTIETAFELVSSVSFQKSSLQGLVKSANVTSILPAVSSIWESHSAFFRSIGEVVRSLDKKSPGLVRDLAMNGWFPTMSAPLEDLFRAQRLFLRGQFQEGDELVAKTIDAELNRIASKLTKLFPTRAVIIEKAFRAHQDGDFELSIPVMLSQSDGIFDECLKLHVGHQLPSGTFAGKRKDDLEQVRLFIESSAMDGWSTHMLLLVTEPELPFKASETVRAAYPDPLNRHAVLHGEDTEYATKIKGLKAISLIHCAAQFHPSSLDFRTC